MENGLKQGCPLSCLLYNLCIDPLLFHINHLGARAYCDDVGVASTDLAFLTPLHAAFSRFNDASGSKSNLTKLYLVSTNPLPPAALDGLPDKWASNIKIVNVAKYLGIKIGRHVNVDNVFHDAITKLEMRTKRYLPLKSNFSLQSRVIIANVFLLPLLSFVFRFFLMPTSQQKQVSKIITEWLGLANRYTFDQLTTHRRNGPPPTPQRESTQPCCHPKQPP